MIDLNRTARVVRLIICEAEKIGRRAPSLVTLSQVPSQFSYRIIGAAMIAYRVPGPGLLESAYEECMCHELDLRRLSYERQKPLPVVYKDVHLDAGYRLDLLVDTW